MKEIIVATILAYTTPAMGHLFPISALLTELRDRGMTSRCAPWPPVWRPVSA